MAAVRAVGQCDEFEVWPENWPAFELFTRITTQWNVGMGGLVGLRYEALYPLLDRADPGEWDNLFEAVRAIERGALDQVAKNKND